MHGEGGHVLQRGRVCVAMGGMRGEGGWQRACVARGHVWQGHASWHICIHAGETTTEVGSTHPTGMHSCERINSF